MEVTGCATEAAICTCAPAQNRCGRPQVLPAYGLQDLRNSYRDPKTKSNPNTTYLQITLGENHGSGHFYLAKTRTFLLCVDTKSAKFSEVSFCKAVSSPTAKIDRATYPYIVMPAGACRWWNLAQHLPVRSERRIDSFRYPSSKSCVY